MKGQAACPLPPVLPQGLPRSLPGPHHPLPPRVSSTVAKLSNKSLTSAGYHPHPRSPSCFFCHFHLQGTGSRLLLPGRNTAFCCLRKDVGGERVPGAKWGGKNLQSEPQKLFLPSVLIPSRPQPWPSPQNILDPAALDPSPPVIPISTYRRTGKVSSISLASPTTCPAHGAHAFTSQQICGRRSQISHSLGWFCIRNLL